MDGDGAPRYWLTGKLFCGKCGESMQGVSGTSMTGRKYHYYYCKAQRKKKVRKELVEGYVTMLLAYLLSDSENLASIAVDAAAYYSANYRDTHYLEALEAKRKDVEKAIANLVKAIAGGVLSDAVTQSLTEHEAQKKGLDEAIQTETARAALFEDEHNIQAYFDRFLHADMDNPKTRDAVMEYFADKIYLYDDRLVAVLFYSEDRTEISWDEDGVFSIDPFAEGEAIEFDCFPFGSTANMGAPFHRRIWRMKRRPYSLEISSIEKKGDSFSCGKKNPPFSNCS